MKASSTFLGSDIETNAKCPQKFASCVALERVSGPGALMLSIILSICTSFQHEDEQDEDFALADQCHHLGDCLQSEHCLQVD